MTVATIHILNISFNKLIYIIKAVDMFITMDN